MRCASRCRRDARARCPPWRRPPTAGPTTTGPRTTTPWSIRRSSPATSPPTSSRSTAAGISSSTSATSAPGTGERPPRTSSGSSRRPGGSGASSRSGATSSSTSSARPAAGSSTGTARCSSAATPKAGTPQRPYRWLSFVSHEYFHAFNVKRLRPIELGPFDYETPPRTGSLWISEGLTTYFGDLIVVRAGLATPSDFLGALSASIAQLQGSPGRLSQTLEQSSFDVWSSGVSGVGRDPATTVSYYVKGLVVGFLLDARIRRATDDRRGLEDVMRLAYRRHSGERGFTADDFRAAAEEVAGADLKEWFRTAVSFNPGARLRRGA